MLHLETNANLGRFDRPFLLDCSNHRPVLISSHLDTSKRKPFQKICSRSASRKPRPAVPAPCYRHERTRPAGSGRCRMFGPVHKLAYPPSEEYVAHNLSIAFAVVTGDFQLLYPFK